MAKKILIVLSEWGYWGEELLAPLEIFDVAGYEVTFATPKGKRPHALPPSMDANYIDPPLGRSVTTEEMARKVRQLEQSDRLNNPVNLSTWLPESPYWSSPNFLRAMEAYYRAFEAYRRIWNHMMPSCSWEVAAPSSIWPTISGFTISSSVFTGWVSR
jgi:hypothetical protein